MSWKLVQESATAYFTLLIPMTSLQEVPPMHETSSIIFEQNEMRERIIWNLGYNFERDLVLRW